MSETLNLKGKTVLVTGGAGFLGRALVRRFLDLGCEHVKVYSRDEHKHETFRKELWMEGGRSRFVRFIIGDVAKPEMLKYSLRDVDYLVHAAALKIVPVLQYNPIQAIEVNVNGWLGVVKAVLEAQRPMTVVGVSTDKACSPLNTYGKAKALGEDLFINANVYSPDMVFHCVRYGNVIGSTSSLVEGLREHPDVPELTHAEMTRFFISVERAVDTVVWAMTCPPVAAGTIYVPKCKAVLIKDLVRHLTGKADYKLTGMRPGEKLHEELINKYESMRTVEWSEYYGILPEVFVHDRGGPYYIGERPERWLNRAMASEDPALRMTEEEMRDAFKQRV